MKDYWVVFLISMLVFNLIGGGLIWYLQHDKKKRTVHRQREE